MAIAKLSETRFSIKLPFLALEAKWEIDETQKNAAWEMYVELATRITTAQLGEDEGLLREAMTSFHSLFPTTRVILKKYGPSIATPSNPDDITFGHLSVAILNKIVRPVLAKWHPKLTEHEAHKPADRSITEHEVLWVHNQDLRAEINRIRLRLIEYADVLAEVAGVARLTDYPTE